MAQSGESAYEKLKMLCLADDEDIVKKNVQALMNGKCEIAVIRQHSNRQQDCTGQVHINDAVQEARDIVQQHLHSNGFDLAQAIVLSRYFIEMDQTSLLDHFTNNDQAKNGAQQQQANPNDVTDHMIVTCPKLASLDAGYLCTLVLAQFRKFCINSMDLNCCTKIQQEIDKHKNVVIAYSAYGSRNGRRKMEDKHCVVPCLDWAYPDRKILTYKPSAYFAIFDGHGGRECASYAACHMLNHVMRSRDTSATPISSENDDVTQAIECGFEDCDEALQEKCRNENLKSGSTATCVFISGNSVYFSWLGDSQVALIDKSGKCSFVSVRHDTKNQAECDKIIENGGVILNILGANRVNGVLNVTRTLGDQFLKPPLSAKPQIHKMELTGTEKCIVIGSDGLWDGLSPDYCAQAVIEFYSNNNKPDFEHLAKFLVKKAEDNGVGDNVTVLVIFLHKE